MYNLICIENNKFGTKRINSSVQNYIYKRLIFDSINKKIILFGINIICELFQYDF